MTDLCSRCGDQELRLESTESFRHALPQLRSPLEVVRNYSCPRCGGKSSRINYFYAGNRSEWDVRAVEAQDGQPPCLSHKHGQIGQTPVRGKRWLSISYPAVYRVGEGLLFPDREGHIEDATMIDRFGNPELMVEFASAYFRQYYVILPDGHWPNSLSDFMPGLLLLVTATELAIKAFLIRSETSFDRIHSLSGLYNKMDSGHRDKVARHFASAVPNANLKALGVAPRIVEGILGTYDDTYGKGIGAYLDTRYYAEPTTKTFRADSDLHGSNLVKGNTPYPIFLPWVLRALIRTFEFFSGPERLRRRGADIHSDFRSRGDGNHGDWGLIPASLDLVVLSGPQAIARDANYQEREAFRVFKAKYPPGFATSWKYGGQALLFYSAGGRRRDDRMAVIEGIECRVRYDDRLGMHSRDTYRLADALEGDGFGQLNTDMALGDA